MWLDNAKAHLGDLRDGYEDQSKNQEGIDGKMKIFEQLLEDVEAAWSVGGTGVDRTELGELFTWRFDWRVELLTLIPVTFFFRFQEH